MKTYLLALLAAVLMSFGAGAFAADEESAAATTRTSSSTSLEVEELKPVAEGSAAGTAPAAKPARSYQRNVSGQPRPKDLDFRHCLELTDNAAIAQCAQEQ